MPKPDPTRRPPVVGTVVRGRGLGRALGAATANLRLSPRRRIPYGSYAAHAWVRGRTHRALAHVGVRPSIGGGERLLEVHLLDFDGALYGATMRVRLLAIVSEELTLSTGALRRKIAADLGRVRAFFAREAMPSQARERSRAAVVTGGKPRTSAVPTRARRAPTPRRRRKRRPARRRGTARACHGSAV
ncbi:MAG: riboflavin kinase [Deltaproteobacteria bacterium]|nr:riboflavin kinase [Deltaproteobacteria bacterium]